MADQRYKAMVVNEMEENTFSRSITDRAFKDLPDGEVLVRVKYSSLNYKDALSASGNKGVTRKYPHTPGIDAAGVVAESVSPEFQAGDEVIVTGFDLGMNTAGGFGQYIRVPAAWLLKRPAGLTEKESMAYGTAGLTAGLCIYELINSGITPESGEVLVTGASGGVGSLAAAMLVQCGYAVAGVSGKEKTFLENLGVKKVLTREEAVDTSKRPLLKGRWAGVVDTVGGDMLATAIKSTKEHGAISCCGNVASFQLNTTVFPFILRGIRLIGIDSQNCPMPVRREIWQHLAGDWRPGSLDQMVNETDLDGLDEKIGMILKGKLQGRMVVNLPE